MKTNKMLAALLALTMVTGCSSGGSSTPKTTPEPTPTPDTTVEYTYGDLVFHLPKDMAFDEISAEGFEYSLASDKILIFVTHQTKEQLAELGREGITIDEYADVVTEGSENLELAKLHDSAFRAKYTFENENYKYHYATDIIERPDAFWIINVTCFEQNWADLEKTMEECLDLVEFKQ